MLEVCVSHSAMVQVIPASGGLSTFLFQLSPAAVGSASTQGPLGKLEIRWRGSMGESGRLQTQQIQASNPPAAEVQVRDTRNYSIPEAAQHQLQLVRH